MRVVLAFVWILSTPLFAADACKAPATLAANRELARKFHVAFNTKSKALLDEILAKDWLDIPLGAGQAAGRDGLKAVMDGFWVSFPDLKITDEDVVSQGNRVVVRALVRGTHRAPFAGVKASGKAIEVMTIDMHEICDGHIVKTWHAEDWLSGLFQMGALR